MCDIVVDMAGHQNKTIDLCAQLTKANGTVLLFGLPPAKKEDTTSIRVEDFTRSLRYICSYSPGMDSFQLAMEFLEQGRFDPSPLFTHKMPFEQFPEAYDMASNYKDGVIKVLLTFESH
jgi:threonine dehydrogenase-like Zn-dependent dehydrogenase